MVNQKQSPGFIAVTCKCGRNLRAKSDQIGTEIRCWDCHQMVAVPLPSQGHRVARELSDSALEMIKGPGLNSVLYAAAAVTAVLCIPVYGTWCSVIALAVGASAYGEIIRRVSREATEKTKWSWRWSLIPRSILMIVLCASMAAGTVVPLWILNAEFQHSPHWDGRGLAVAATTWLIVPLLMFLVSARKDDGTPLGLRRGLQILARHPFATLVALAVIPTMLVLIEIALDLIFYIPGNFAFFALDYMPMPQTPEKPMLYQGIPHFRQVDFRSYPDSMFIAGYIDGIRHGYTFAGAIPASLANLTRANLNAQALGTVTEVYTIVRGLLTMLIVTCLIAAFAIQARWLGSIPALDKKRPA